MFHRCKWIDESTTTTPGAGHLRAASVTQEAVLYILYGITNIKQRCTGCGKVRIVTTPGKVSS